MSKFINRGYQSKTSKDCKVSNLSEEEIEKIISSSEDLIFTYLTTYLSKEQLQTFKEGNTSLISLGVCTGILNSINDELQVTINEHLCILDTDTLNKFKEDIIRDF